MCQSNQKKAKPAASKQQDSEKIVEGDHGERYRVVGEINGMYLVQRIPEDKLKDKLKELKGAKA